MPIKCNEWIRKSVEDAYISIATVIGPTPPGTGVIHEAIPWHESKSTSPTRRVLPFSSGRNFPFEDKKKEKQIHTLHCCNTTIDHNCIFFQPRSLNELRFAQTGNDNFRWFDLRRKTNISITCYFLSGMILRFPECSSFWNDKSSPWHYYVSIIPTWAYRQFYFFQLPPLMLLQLLYLNTSARRMSLHWIKETNPSI